MKKKIKILLITIFVLFNVNNSLANKEGAQSSKQVTTSANDRSDSPFSTGFYGGIAGGYTNLKTKFRGTFDDGFGTPLSKFNFDTTGSDGGVVGEIFLGGQTVLKHCFLLGLEVSGLIDSNHTSKTAVEQRVNGVSFRFTGDRTWAVIPSIVGGYIFHPAIMGYVKLGLGISRYETKVREVTPGIPPTFSLSKKKTLVGFAPAVGLAYALNQSLSLRGEIGCEIYNSMKIRADTAPLGAETIITKIRPRVISAKVGITYKF